jgi:trigger factor
MQIDIADVGTLRKQLTVTYSADEFRSRQSELLERYSSQVNLKGFRNGKVPKAVLKKRFGQQVEAEVMEQMLNKAVQQGLQDHKLHPVGPSEDSKPETENGLRYVTSFDIRPEIELPEPASLTVVRGDLSPSDEEVQEEIESILRRAGQTRPLTDEETLIQDDQVTVSGKITSGDDTIREIHDLNHVLGAYPLFGKPAEQVLALTADKKAGLELEFDSTLPDTFRPEEWAGKEAHIQITIQQASRLAPAELNKDLFERFGVEDEAGFRERVIENLRSRKENTQHRAQTEELTEQLINQTSFELPERLLSDMIESHLQQAVQRAKQQDENADEEAVRKDEEPQAKDRAERFLRRNFIMEVIAERYEIEASREDLQQQIMMAAYQSGQRPEEIIKYLQDSGQIHQVAAEIREAKALEHFLSLVIGDEATDSEIKTEASTAEA